MEDRERAGRDKLCGRKKKRTLEELSPEEREQIRRDHDNVRHLARKYNIDGKLVLNLKGLHHSVTVTNAKPKKKPTVKAASTAQKLIDRIRARTDVMIEIDLDFGWRPDDRAWMDRRIAITAWCRQRGIQRRFNGAEDWEKPKNHGAAGYPCNSVHGAEAGW
jgi:hypothetical protein